MGSERTVQETLPLLSNSRGRSATVSISAPARREQCSPPKSEKARLAGAKRVRWKEIRRVERFVRATYHEGSTSHSFGQLSDWISVPDNAGLYGGRHVQRLRNSPISPEMRQRRAEGQ